MIFAALTATVFMTKKDFSFLRGALIDATFAMFGIALAAMLFGFDVGMLYCAAGVVLMAVHACNPVRVTACHLVNAP